MISVFSIASATAHLYSYRFRHHSFFILFDLEAEGNLSTWFASTLLLAAAVLLFVIGRSSESFLALRWKILSLVFLYIAIDEAAQLHEFTILHLRNAMNLSGVFYFSWVVVAIPIVALLAIFYIRFLLSLPSPVRELAFTAATLYVSGALGMEMINAAHAEIYGHTLKYELMTDLEETLELVGIALWLFALLRYLQTLCTVRPLRTRPAAAAR
jgi:hypothetical protein